MEHKETTIESKQPSGNENALANYNGNPLLPWFVSHQPVPVSVSRPQFHIRDKVPKEHIDNEVCRLRKAEFV